MKWIIRGFGIVVLVAVIAVVGVLMLPADRIARIASEQLTRLTGRMVTVSGDVSMTFWPVLGVSAGGLEVGNADWAKEGAMFTTAQAAIGVDAAALLRGEIRITNVEANSPTIRLQSRKDGRANWIFTDADGAAEITAENAPDDAGNTPLTIERLVIRDAALIYDAEGADLVSYSGVDLTLDWPEQGGAAQIDAALRPAGQVVKIAAKIDRFAGFLDGQVQPINLSVASNGGGLTLNGRASIAGAVAGAFDLKTTDTGAFLAALGAGSVSLPKGLGQNMHTRADITLTPDRRLSLRDLVADLGGNTLRGAADIELNGKPQINAQLQAGALNLAGLAGGENADGGAADTGWSRVPIDASGLATFNGGIALNADSIDLGALKLGRTRSLLTNDRARMVFELREVAAYGGLFTGEFVMNNRNGLSVGGKLRAAGVEMRGLLTDLAGLTRFSGRGDAEVSFLGVGQTVDAIMRSLSGKGAVNIGRGSIEGIDLDDLLGSFDVKGGTTVFDALTATFSIDKGVLSNSNLKMLLPNFEATGAGKVNLGAQSLDYTVTPKALRVNKERGLAVPVRIAGPWRDPKITADVKAVIDLNFREEVKRAEDKAKQKLEQKLDDELGLTRQEGQSVEEAVKDKLEDKLKKELFKIFD
ncbi:AsmA family protein [Sulfitobacter sp. M57]|uniref:AsmA family protein n=1 Tax=unclassified Sulfitobacter TaxID=196795 RepID=UPI0023E16093|nr:MULTISPECIES: AsmA family protein [unclassified Sulfitobacter]MDF3412902.1 AsmA family protein [Sulfitobacter sp. KE5]MDF3421814.1 AsmA family protein [Sulfitobacter sp. KE43]MDF3431451.1 AsmA family protein [Sulfitobacter sp. KE42]MDF3457092.1 AsmA family protein [Sulfitobacter sp. S74]MDF3460995.1 AsmA family protein [Sulfitobacter sp. Ks18]